MMPVAKSSSNSSHLSSERYGYDFVVSTTQGSINAMMKQYLLANKKPEVCCCFINKDGEETQVSLEEVLSKSNNTNPFMIPHNTDLNDLKIQRINDARFIRGWRARLGIPQTSDPSEVRDLVEIGSSNEAVNFHLLCAEFQVVSYIEGARFSKPYWLNVSQPKNNPWIFSSRVNLAKRILDPGKSSDEVPIDVKNKLKQLQKETALTDFTIEQLFLDLDNAGLMDEGGKLEGIRDPSPEYTMLKETFLGSYFDQMKRDKMPLLSSTIRGPAQNKPVAESTLQLTNFIYNLSPYLGANGQPVEDPDPFQKKAATLNYLCAADGHFLPARTPFTWNWIDVSDLRKFHGTIAIKRNCLAEYMGAKLAQHVLPSCIEPTFKMWKTFSEFGMTWDFTKTATEIKPVITATGDKTLQIAWASPTYTEDWSDRVSTLWATAKSSYNLDLEFVANSNSMRITQQFVLNFEAKEAWSRGKADIVDQSRTDTYEISVNDRGKLEATCTPGSLINNSKDFKLKFSFFSDPGWAKSVQDKSYYLETFKPHQIPLSFVQDYVFPGGKAFIFKDVTFSEYSDLVSHITYADP